MSVPYAAATSGERARGEIVKLLQRFGCESVGFMDEFAEGSLLLAFTWRGQQVQLRASARGWAEIPGTPAGATAQRIGSGVRSSR